MRVRRRGSTVLVAALAATALGAPPGAGAAERCSGQDEPIVAGNIAPSERTLLCLVNVYRAASGLPVLAHDPSLRTAARGHSEDMVSRGYFSHTSPDGSGPRERAIAAGYPSDAGIGENIGADQGATPRRMFQGWRESPGHNANLLHPDWVTAGMGFAVGTPPPLESPNGATGTQLFGTADTGASDTAVDLLEGEGCEQSNAKVERLERRVARLKRKVNRAAAKGKGAKKRKAKRRLRKVRSKLRDARAQGASACAPDSF